jgi:threonine dehydratase
MSDHPSLDAIAGARTRLGTRVVTTPLRRLDSVEVHRRLGDTGVLLKEELFQLTGSFKPRGALTVMSDLSATALSRGVTCASAGNHAVATAYAARVLGTRAKVVMPATVNPARLARVRGFGAEVELVDDMHGVFARAQAIAEAEQRTFVHPFEGYKTVLGTATLGLEVIEQAGDFDAVIVPVGGGGLLAGVAAAVKQSRPRALVFGVEPLGADVMRRSFLAGTPQRIDRPTSIADSLCAPHAGAYCYELCRRFVDDLAVVDEDQLRDAMRLLFDEGKLAVEPAGAAALAALCGPLRERLAGRRVVLVVSGSNIDHGTFARHLAAGEAS